MSLNKGKEISNLNIMSVRLKSKDGAGLNRKTLDDISRRHFAIYNATKKDIKRGDAKVIREKITDKRNRDKEKVRKSTSLSNAEKKARIAKIEASRKAEVKKAETLAAAAREKRASIRKEVDKLLDKGIGVFYLNNGNLRFKDLTIKKDRESMLKDLSIFTNSNVSRADLQKRIKQYEKAEKGFKNMLRRRRAKDYKPYKVNRKRIANGVRVEYLFDYTGGDDFNIYTALEANLTRALNNTKHLHPNAPFNIRLSQRKGADVMKAVKDKNGSMRLVDTRAFSLPRYDVWTLNDILEQIEDKFERVEEDYDEEDIENEAIFDFQTLAINYLVEPAVVMGSGGHKTLAQANSIWFISDTTSKSNCFYRSISFIRLMKDFNVNEDIEYVRSVMLEENAERLINLINNRAKNMKKRIKDKSRKTTTEDDIQNWVDSVSNNGRERAEVKIYNNVFGLEKTIKPSNNLPVVKTYEVWCINHHFVPLVRWYSIKNIKEICEEKVQLDIKKAEEEAEKDENTIIDKKIAREITDDKHFEEWCYYKYNYCINLNPEDEEEKRALVKYSNLYKYFHTGTEYVRNSIIFKNNRIATYDLEATGNGNNDFFKTYRISLAWNNLDEKGHFVSKNYENTSKWLENRKTNGDSVLGLGYNFKSFSGRDCITKFFDFIYKNREIFEGFTFYAHNGGKYDLLLLLNEYILTITNKWVIEEDSLIVLNGAYLNLVLNSVGDTNSKGEKWKGGHPPSIKFRDSMRLLPMSLEKLCIDFDVPHKKNGKDLEVDFDEINIGNCYGEAKHSANKLFSTKDFFIELSQRVYCDYDTIGLLECLNIFNKDIYDAMNIDMTGCLTGASLSKQNFFKNYYIKKQIPIYHLCSEMDAFCREGYMGGRCEAHYIGEHKEKCYYYDFTSLYPDVGRRLLPYGRPKYVEKERIERWNRNVKAGKKPLLIIGMLKLRIKTKENMFDTLPVHGIKQNGKLIFPHFENWTEITLWANEFNYGYSLGIYDYELISAIHFGEKLMMKKGERETFWDEGILKSFFEEAVDKKALAKKQKKPALAQSYKIVANSGYGFWGLNANGDDGYGRDGMSILAKDDMSFWELLRKGEVNNVGAVGEYTLVRTTKPMPCKDFNVSIAAAISSEARIKIHKFMNGVLKVGGKLLYCDTDSCICNIKLKDYPELMEEFCWDGTGEALGSMKNEAEEKLEKYFKKVIEKDSCKENRKYLGNPKEELKKLMKKQLELDGGEYHFDKGIVAGCKQYCLRKTTFDGGIVEAEASKGCKRSLDYTDFHHLLYGSKMEEQKAYEEKIREKRGGEWIAPEGFRLYEEQTQFRSGLIEHIKEGNSKCDVKIVHLDKSMRVRYQKGLVGGKLECDGVRECGEVKPLIL